MAEPVLEPDDPQVLLPQRLRGTWAVMPRISVYGVFIAGSLVGAGLTCTVIGFVLERPALRFGFFVALAVAWLVSRAIGAAEHRRVREWQALGPTAS